MGYTKFSSYEYILSYDYKTVGELNDAIGALKAMYSNKNISKYQYDNAIALLEDKLDYLR